MLTSDPQPEVRLDYIGDTSGTYAGFDRFGWVIDHRSYDYGASPGDVEERPTVTSSIDGAEYRRGSRVK